MKKSSIHEKYRKNWFKSGDMEELYQSYPDPWAYSTTALERYAHVIEKAREFLENVNIRTILEVACSEGVFTKMLTEVFPTATIHGCDISKTALGRAIARTAGTTSYFHLVDIGKDRLPLPAKSVQLLFLCDVLYLLPSKEEIQFALHEVDRVLDPDGVVVVTEFIRTRKFSNMVCKKIGRRLHESRESVHFDIHPTTGKRDDTQYYRFLIFGRGKTVKEKNKAGIMGFRTMNLIQQYSLYAVPHYLRKFYPLAAVCSGNVVVDAACGYGETGQVLYVNRTSLGCYHGYDIDPKKIESAKRHLNKSQYHYTCMDLREPLPLPDASVDVFISEEFIEHVEKEDAVNFLREVVRVLKPRSRFLLSTPRRCQGIIQRLEIGHLYEWDYNELLNFVKELGFKIVEQFGLGFYERINTLPDDLYKNSNLYKAMRRFLPNQFTKTIAALPYPEKSNTVYLHLEKRY